MKLILLIFLFLFLSTQSFSQSTPQEITKRFLEVYKQGDTDKALDYLFSNSPYAKDIQESLENVKGQLKKDCRPTWEILWG